MEVLLNVLFNKPLLLVQRVFALWELRILSGVYLSLLFFNPPIRERGKLEKLT